MRKWLLFIALMIMTTSAQDVTPLVYSRLSDNWSLAAAEISKQKTEINSSYTNRGLECSGLNASAQNDAIVSVVKDFYIGAIEYIKTLAELQLPINKDSVSEKFNQYKTTAQSQTVKDICGDPISDASATSQISGAAGGANQQLQVIVPDSLSRPDLVIDSLEAYISSSGDSLYVFFNILNYGSVKTDTTYFSFLASGAGATVFQCPPLNPYEYMPNFRFTKIISDSTLVIILADQGDSEEEISETNNSATKTYLTPIPVFIRQQKAHRKHRQVLLNDVNRDLIGRFQMGRRQ